MYGEDLMNSFLQEKIVKSWSKQIKNFGDFQLHSTELKLEGLPKGQYVILASPDKNFTIKNNAIAYGSFWCSNLSYVYRKNDDETFDVTVLDRETGAMNYTYKDMNDGSLKIEYLTCKKAEKLF